MAFNRPTLAVLIDRIKADIKANMPSSDPWLRRSILGAFAKVWAVIAHGLYGFIAYVAKNLIIDTAEGAWLERWASIWGIFRKEPTLAMHVVDFTGNNGATVTAGSTVQTASGVQFTVNADTPIAAGTAAVSITAVEGFEGAQANLDPGATVSLVNPIPGVDTDATVDSTTTVGVDTETDDDLRARLLFTIRNPPDGGSVNDYIRWATSIPGVTRAWCYKGALGRGTVLVLIVMDNSLTGPIPDAGTITATQTYIDGMAIRPVTADVTVAGPIADALAMSIQLSPNTADIQDAITAEVVDLMLRQSHPASADGEVIIPVSQIREAVSAASEDEVDNIVVAPAANVTALKYHMPVLTLPITFAAIP